MVALLTCEVTVICENVPELQKWGPKVTPGENSVEFLE